MPESESYYDKQLIERFRSGDKAVFGELVMLYKDRVFNTCYRFLLNREDAEDVAQEVFVEVFQSLRSFRGHSKLSTWIYRIAVTRSLDEIKKRNRKKRISSLGRLVHLDDLVGWLAGGAAADQTVNDKDAMKEIAQALDTLPENQRVAFTLSKVQGYNNAEIAEIMDTTTVAVESMIYRAKKKLSTELADIIRKNR